MSTAKNRRRELVALLGEALPPVVAQLEARRLASLAEQLLRVEPAERQARLLAHGLELVAAVPALSSAREAYDRAATALLALRCVCGADVPEALREQAALLAFALADAAPTERLQADALSALRSAPLAARANGDAGRSRCQHLVEARLPLWRLPCAAFGLLVDAWPEAAAHSAGLRLADLDPRPAGFLLRAFMVRALAETSWGSALLTAHAARPETSETVRQALAQALISSAQARPAAPAFPPLARLLDPAAEPAPRVRAHAALILTKVACSPDGHADTRGEAARLVEVALTDPDDLVRRATVEALRSLGLCALRGGTEPGNASAVIGRLAQSLRRHALTTTLPAEAALFADAAEALRAWGDPQAAPLVRSLAAHTATLGEGEAGLFGCSEPPASREVGRVLALLSQEDLGLYAGVTHRGIMVRRGMKERWAAWRLLHELSHPRPDKRREVSHVAAPFAAEPLRAHAATVASGSPTLFDGERLVSPREGAWGRHLPPPDDLLATPLFGAAPVQIFSSRGVTILQPPSTLWRRLQARVKTSRRYMELAALRHRSLGAERPEERRRYAEAVRALGFALELEPYCAEDAVDMASESLFYERRLPRADGSLVLAVALPGPLQSLLGELRTPVGNDLGQLALFVAGVGALLFASAGYSQWRAERDRRRVPLTVGGWGTRGKSSLERLKAAMFTGLGYEVLCKTTGSMATLVYAAPWERPVELPIYRAAERATIWEQRDVLHWAAELGVQVLTWECMAIRPSLAEVMQGHWLRDSVCTLTNTHPDHEDKQGPGAVDVVRSLCHITPAGGTVLTGEQAMLPVVRAEVTRRSATLLGLEKHEHELIPQDLLDLFPDLAHRRNVSLLRLLARHLGFDPDVATVEAAENVLLEVGVLRRIGPIPIGEHQVTFVNSMAANDLTSTLENLVRIDCRDPSVLVVFSNTRRDRPTRTEAFARMVARDVDAALRVFSGDDAAMAHRCFCRQAELLASEIEARTREEAEAQLLRACRRAGITSLEAAAEHAPEARPLAARIHAGPIDAGLLAALRRFATDLLVSTAVTAPPTADAAVAVTLAHMPAGEVAIFAAQNIKGVGRALVAAFTEAEQLLGLGPQPPSDISAAMFEAALDRGLVPSAAACTALASRAARDPAYVPLAALAAERVRERLKRRDALVGRLWAALRLQLEGGVAPLRYVWQRFKARRVMRRFVARQMSAAAARELLVRLR